ESSGARFPADEREAQKIEGFRLALAAPRPGLGREAAELDETRLVLVQRQRKLPQPFAHRVPERFGVALVLKADDGVVRVSHDDHVAFRLPPSPAVRPEIEYVMQVNVGEQRRYYGALPGPLFLHDDDPFVQDARLQPFLDQADDAFVADPMLDEADQPFLADFVEEAPHRLPISMRSPI